jgi:hypothetical protein
MRARVIDYTGGGIDRASRRIVMIFGGAERHAPHRSDREAKAAVANVALASGAAGRLPPDGHVTPFGAAELLRDGCPVLLADRRTGRIAIVLPGDHGPDLQSLPLALNLTVEGAARMLAEIAGIEGLRTVVDLDERMLLPGRGLPVVDTEDVLGLYLARAPLVELVASAALPTPFGTFTCHGFHARLDGAEHLAITRGPMADGCLTAVHRACLLGQALRSAGCNCRRRLEDDLSGAADDPAGAILVFLRPDPRSDRVALTCPAAIRSDQRQALYERRLVEQISAHLRPPAGRLPKVAA